MYFLYNLALLLASPIILGWAAGRSLMGRLPGFFERLGFLPPLEPPASSSRVWLHAVSLGEMKVAAFLAEHLRGRFPDVRFVLSASTRTGHDEARRRAGAGDTVIYPPLDYAWLCRRFLKHCKPKVVVILETELWPNLIREANRSGAALLLVNGRVSDHSLPRYYASRLFWRRVLRYPDFLYVQSQRDADRFASIGAPPSRIHVAGNLKFSVRPVTSQLDEELSAALRSTGVGPVIVAGSTMPGEEHFLLEAFQALKKEFPLLWMILAPRHPERAAAIAAEIRSAGIRFQFRSDWRAGQPVASGIFLLDSTGELAGLYQLASAAFIGGTLVPAGGHNLLEPAHFACPIVTGPSMENFHEIAVRFREAQAVLQVRDAAELATVLRDLLLDPKAARALGNAAHDLLNRQTSGLEPLLEELGRRLGGVNESTLTSLAASQPSPTGVGRLN